jgi:hypothetical protein
MVNYRIEDDYLEDNADLDPLILRRELIIQSPKNLERFKYQPFQSPAVEIIIGPTSVERPNWYQSTVENWAEDVATVGRPTELVFPDEDEDEDEVKYEPEPPEPYPGYYESMCDQISEKASQGVCYVLVIALTLPAAI